MTPATNLLTDWHEIMEAYHSGDKVLERVATDSAIANLDQFIWKKLWSWYSSYMQKHKDDLYNEAVIGILEGMKNFDLTKGQPTTHFNHYIKQQTHAFISEQVNGASGYYMKHVGIVTRCIEQFEDANEPYNPESIAVATGLPLETVLACIAIKQGTESPTYYDAEEYTTARGSAAISQSAEDAFLDSCLTETLEVALNQLDPKTAKMIGLTIPGWYTHEEMTEILGFEISGKKATKKELAKAFGIPESEVATYIRKGKTRLKKILLPNQIVKRCKNADVILKPKEVDLDNFDIIDAMEMLTPTSIDAAKSTVNANAKTDKKKKRG